MNRYSKGFKITMCDLVRERSQIKSVQQALFEVSVEAQMPYSTLRNWYYSNGYDKYRANKGWNG